MLNTRNPKELLQMQVNEEVNASVGDIVKFEDEEYKVVEVKGKALHLKRTVFPFDSFLVSNDVVTKV